MNAKTAEALEKSIEHWRGNVEGAIDAASANGEACALCDTFQDTFDESGFCAKCPVSKRSSKRFCVGTPFEAAYDALRAWRLNKAPENEAAFRVAAREELAFLESLREPIDAAADAKIEE